MALVDYAVEWNEDYLMERLDAVLAFLEKEAEQIRSKISSLGPRPKDDRSHLSEWSRLERDLQLNAEYVWDAKIMKIAFEKHGEATIVIKSSDLRWFYPDLL